MTEKQEICENCGKTEENHYWYKGILYCENWVFKDDKSKKFTPKNHSPQEKASLLHCCEVEDEGSIPSPEGTQNQVDLNDVLKLVRETLNFSNSKDRLIEKLKALHSQEVDVRRQKEDNNSSPDTQNHKKGCGKCGAPLLTLKAYRGGLCPTCQEKEK